MCPNGARASISSFPREHWPRVSLEKEENHRLQPRGSHQQLAKDMKLEQAGQIPLGARSQPSLIPGTTT